MSAKVKSVPDFEGSQEQGLDTTTNRLTPEQLETRRIQNQSHEEWWADYDSYTDDTYPHIKRELNKMTKAQLLAESPTNPETVLQESRIQAIADLSIDKKPSISSQESGVEKELFISYNNCYFRSRRYNIYLERESYINNVIQKIINLQDNKKLLSLVMECLHRI